MKKRLKDGDSFKESRIISTDDIFVGTDLTSSLSDHINEQDEEISNLKKWTKWYVKYGGMGSGGGSGSGGSGKFGYKIYFKESSTVAELTGSTINLWGQGTYTVSFNLTKTQGHSFTVKYRLEDSSWISKTIAEGNSSIDISLKLTKKVIFSYQIIDNSTDDETGERYCTIIPESFSIMPSLNYTTGSPLDSSKNNAVSYEVAKNGLIAKFNYEIFEEITIYWKIRYKLESDSDWTLYDSGEFPSDSSGETISGVIETPIDLYNLDKETSLGRSLTFELIYGASESSLVTPQGSITITVIPDTLYYFLIYDNEGRLYHNQPDEESYGSINKIKKGYIPFYINPCSGQGGNSPLVYVSLYKLEGEEWVLTKGPASQALQVNVAVSISDKFKLNVTESGLYKIIAALSPGEYPGESNLPSVKYFYVRDDASNWTYDYYEKLSPSSRSATHFYYEDSDRPEIDAVSFYNNSYTKSIDTSNLDNAYNYNIALGIQYDKSNDDQSHFIELTGRNGNLKIFQNKVQYGAQNIIEEYYFPKTTNSNETEASLWHLLNININFVRTTDDGITYFYEFCLYIDGVLEGISSGQVSGTTSTALSYDYKFNSITINPSEKHIIKLNLFEISFTNLERGAFFNESNSDFYRKYTYMYDMYATTYYNKYISSLGLEELKVKETANFNKLIEDFQFDEYGIPYTNITNLGNIISSLNSNETEKLLKVPILILCPNEEGIGEGKFFTDWFLAKWPESPAESDEQKPKPLGGYIYYVPKESYGPLSDFEIKDKNGRRVGFNFEIQGSSTRSFGVKNIELSIVQTENYTTVFTPNFDRDDPNTFLPEASFTLKADMVDSSTCNNNSIGDFINDNTSPLDADNCPARDNQCPIKNHIKNCLTGFPVLVFINVDNGNRSDKIYFAGIYNFNLGRKSYFNLGYYESYPQKILDLMTDSIQGTFKILDVPSPIFTSNLTVTEISNGNKYFDFSQYNDTVLFGSSTDDYSMFSHSDSVYANETVSKNILRNAVKQISRAGGYIFKTLGKNFKKLNDQNEMPYMIQKNGVSCNCVSDYRYQYSRPSGTTEFNLIDNVENEAVSDDLIDCIGVSKIDISGNPYTYTPYLDLRSTVEYYVVCMIFGMVDSVLKNLELKSWNPKTIFPAFYDMDTALGVNNNGESIDFFAFSDYWTNSVEETDIPGRVKANGVEIYPDFYNKSSSFKGYDTPSSYLFAIAKYATMDIIGVNESLPTFGNNETGLNAPAPLSPVNMYSIYRRLGGSIESAEHFMEEYFIKRHKDIPNSIKNLNYRSKYARSSYWVINGLDAEVEDKQTSRRMKVSDFPDIGKFRGTGIAKKTDWLSSRLHLLDSYFNLNEAVKYRVRKADITYDNGEISEVIWSDIKKASGDYWYYPTKTGISVTFSDDVSITDQIFSVADGTKSTLNIENLLVKAPSYTPIIMFVVGNNPVPYLIGDDTGTLYQLSLHTVGNQQWGIYGSKMFSYVNNLGLFKLSRSTVTSNNLREVKYETSAEIGDNVTSNYEINTPNIESLIFNGNIYSGTLTFSPGITFNRLLKIDLSNSKINTVYTGSLPITELNLTNINCFENTIELKNLPNLNDVKLEGAKIGTLDIPIWKSNISITSNTLETESTSSYGYHNVYIRNLYLNDTRGLGNSSTIKLTISDVNDLETVTANGVHELTIKNCNKLRTVYVNNQLTKLTINSCSTDINITSFKVVGVSTSKEKTISLEDTNITTLDLRNTRHFESISIGGRTVTLSSGALSGCTELKYLENNDLTGTYIINGTSVFYLDSNFTLAKEGGGYPNILFAEGLTNATSEFNCASGNTGSITFEAANWFLTNNYNNGRHSSIQTIDNLFIRQPKIGEYFTDFSKYFEKLSEYTGITSAKQSFYGCGIKYWSKELFNFGAPNGVSINGVFWSSSVNAKIDFLSNIGSKLSSFSDKGPQGEAVTYKIYDNSNTLVSDVNLGEILRPLINITSLNAFSSITATKVNLKDCFKYLSRLTSISRLMWGGNNWYNLVYEDEENQQITSCFQCLSGLTSVQMSFSQTSSFDGNIDLFYVFSENQWKKMSGIFNSNLDDGYGEQFSINKKIEQEDFENLLIYLSRNTNLTILGPIFRNCKINNCNGLGDLIIPYGTNNSKITKLYYTFCNLKAYSGSNEIPISIDENFFQHLPNVQQLNYTFSRMWIENENGIPFNFFKKRKEKTISGYYPDREFQTLEDSFNEEYIYYISSSLENQPELPENPMTESSASEQGYSDNINDINTWISKKPKTLGTNTSRRVYWRASRSISISENDIIIYGSSWTLDGWYEKFNDPIELDVRYFTYENLKITSIEGIFYGCSYCNPFWKYNNEFIENNCSYIREHNGENTYSEYYSTRDCNATGTYREGTEVTDLIGIECDTVETIRVNEHSFKNYTLHHNKIQQLESYYPFIPSDFFLGVTSSCNIRNAFSSLTSTTDTFESTSNNIYKYTALEGFIPEHLLSSLTGLSNFSNWISNVNILPVRLGETNNYSFVPQNFIKKVLSDVRYLFNFHIRTPNHADTSGEESPVTYYVMYNNSINTTGKQVSFSYTFPRNLIHGNSGSAFVEDGNGAPMDVCSGNYEFNYKLILVTSINDITGEITGSEGYINNYFSKSIYNHFFSKDLLYVYTGYIWDRDVFIENIKNNNENIFDGINSYGGIQYGVNRNCILPKCSGNFSNKHIFYGDSLQRISRQTIQGSAYENYWKSTFPTLGNNGIIN